VTSAARAEGRLTVLYDARCRVCTRIAARFAALDRGRRLRIRPLQWAHDDAWASVRRLRAERDLRSALHVVDERGAWAEGGEAMLLVLERLPALAPVAAALRLPLLRETVEPGYRWFAGNRARFAFMAGPFRNRSLGSSQGVGRGEPRRTHGGVEAGERSDGHRSRDAAEHRHGRDDGHPLLRERVRHRQSGPE